MYPEACSSDWSAAARANAAALAELHDEGNQFAICRKSGERRPKNEALHLPDAPPADHKSHQQATNEKTTEHWQRDRSEYFVCAAALTQEVDGSIGGAVALRAESQIVGTG